MSTAPSAFTGAIPDRYERHLVPVIFAPYAQDLVGRIPANDGAIVLESEQHEAARVSTGADQGRAPPRKTASFAVFRGMREN